MHCLVTMSIISGILQLKLRLLNTLTLGQNKNLLIIRECLSTRLPHLKCIGSDGVRSSHLPFKMYKVEFRAFKSPYINACRVNSNTA